ncbi:MAG: leucine-rich repeat domain-containing protein, partial [Thermoanaerobaculia bacterium]|nr:leucine-rich repeat domain-containing protein [Thermoanaerobaculia bacterium]
MFELAKQLIEKEKQERTGRLDLGRCGLTDLEAQVPELFELTWLEELILSNRWLDRRKQKWVENQNSGAYNCLVTLPPSLSRLSRLKILIAGGDFILGWHISDISILEKLTNLNILDLNNNQISDIRILEKLTNLNTLDLSANQISDTRFLEKLTNLNILDLGINQISDIRFLEKLTNLN